VEQAFMPGYEDTSVEQQNMKPITALRGVIGFIFTLANVAKKFASLSIWWIASKGKI
jgi:hypothetical protein